MQPISKLSFLTDLQITEIPDIRLIFVIKLNNINLQMRRWCIKYTSTAGLHQDLSFTKFNKHHKNAIGNSKKVFHRTSVEVSAYIAHDI